MKHSFIPLLVFAVIIAISCGNNPVTPPGFIITEGDWAGFLFHDSISILFTIEGSNLKDMQVSITYDLNLVPDTTYVWSYPSLQIVDDSVYIMLEDGVDEYDFFFELNGGFTSADNVNGTILTVCTFQDSSAAESDTILTTWSAGPKP